MRYVLALLCVVSLLGCQGPSHAALHPGQPEPRLGGQVPDEALAHQEAPAPPAEPAPAAAGVPTAAHPATLHRTTPNGVNVLVREVHAAPTVDVRVFVKNTGSLYEAQFLGAGISHYYEHLVAGGTTANRSEADARKILFEIGNVTNAYTNYDHTAYFITTNSDSFGTALGLLSDWIQHCSLDPNEVEREKQVILKEIQKGEDEANRLIWQLFMETAYRTHPVRHPVIGYTPAFLGITYEDLVAFYRNRYIPDNLVVTVVGNVNAADAYAQVATAFAGMERRPLTAPVLPAEPPQVAPRFAEREKDGLRVAYGCVGWKTIPYVHDDLYPLDLLAYILGNGETSRLTRRLRDELGLVLGVSCSSWTPAFGKGPFYVMFASRPDTVDAAVDAVRDEVARILRDPPTDAEIARAKVRNVTAHVFGHEKVEDIAGSIGRDFMYTGDPDFGARYVEGLQRVTRDDLLRVARQYLTDDTRTVAIVRPPKPAAEGPTTAASVPATAVERLVLPNGVRVLIRPEPSSPQVSMQAWHLGGVLAETETTNGIGALTAELMRRGTTRRPADALLGTLDGLGASLTTTSGNNALGTTLTILSRDFDAGVEIFADVVRNPAFDPAQFGPIQQRQLQAISQADDDPTTEAVNLWRRTFFSAHPYRLASVGTAAAVQALTPEALRAFHHQVVTPANTVIAVYGDVDVAATKAAITAAFGDWVVSGAPVDLAVAPEPERDAAASQIHRDTGKQGVVIVIGYPGVAQDHPDRYALDVIDAVTSGLGFPGGWFHETLRGQSSGLVYVVHAINAPGVGGGYWYVYARTAPEQQDQVLALMGEQFDKIRGDVVTEDELARAKKVCISARQIFTQTNAERAQRDALDELYGLGHDWHAGYAAGITNVTLADVKRVANQYFQGGLTVITGPGGDK